MAARPAGVNLILTEELTDNPGEDIDQEIVQRCEKEGLLFCADWTEGSDKSRFKSAAPILMVAVISGPKPNTTVNSEWKILGRMALSSPDRLVHVDC